MKYTFIHGDVFLETDADHTTYGITQTQPYSWSNRIEIYGENLIEADKLRDHILDLLTKYPFEYALRSL